MRIFTLATLGILALLLVPALPASAGETFNCHTWDVFVGDRETGVGQSADTATYVAAGGIYVVSDGAPVLNPWLFSIWLYFEANGEPGLQRGDEVCDDTNGGQNGECDCLLP